MRKEGQKGIILVVTLWLVAILSVVAANTAYRTRLSMRSTRYRLNRFKARLLAKAALNRGLVLLGDDKNEYEALNEAWAAHQPFHKEGWFEGKGAKPIDLHDAQVDFEVVDEMSKLNINTATPTMLSALLRQEGFEVTDYLSMIEDIARYRSVSSGNGFGSLSPERKPTKGGPLDVLEELFWIEDMDTTLFYGRPPRTNPPGSIVSDGHSETTSDRYANVGLIDCLTVYGEGRININTASPEVLRTIPMLDEIAAEELVRHRAGPDMICGTIDDTALVKPEDLMSLYGVSNLPEMQYKHMAPHITTSSDTFSITSKSRIESSNTILVLNAVVRRNREDSTFKILSWREWKSAYRQSSHRDRDHGGDVPHSSAPHLPEERGTSQGGGR